MVNKSVPKNLHYLLTQMPCRTFGSAGVKAVVNKTANSTNDTDEDYIGIPEKLLPNFLMGFSVGYKL